MNSQSNAYKQGHDYYTEGGRDTENPYEPNTTRYEQWEQGFNAAKTEAETKEMEEHFSDICEH